MVIKCACFISQDLIILLIIPIPLIPPPPWVLHLLPPPAVRFRTCPSTTPWRRWRGCTSSTCQRYLQPADRGASLMVTRKASLMVTTTTSLKFTRKASLMESLNEPCGDQVGIPYGDRSKTLVVTRRHPLW